MSINKGTAEAGREDEPLLPSASGAAVTTGASRAPPPSSAAHKRARAKSLRAVLLTNFLSATGFSLMLSTMWPYLRDMTGGDSYKSRLGLVVAAFSIGQIVGGPFWGWYSSKRPYAETFYLTIFIRMIGNLLYSAVGGLHTLDPMERYDLLVVSRVIVGFGAGAMAVSNAYVTGATTKEERAGWLGILAASGGIGFIIGPLIGSSFESQTGHKEKYVNVTHDGGVEIVWSYTTAPAYVAAFLCIVNILVLVRDFKDMSLIGRVGRDGCSTKATGSVNVEGEDDEDEDEVPASTKNRDYVAVFVLLFIYFGNMCILSIFETVGVPLTMDEFSWNPSQADLGNGIIAGVGGIVGVIFFASAKAFSTKFGERKVLIFGLFIVVLSQVGVIPYAGKRLMLKFCGDRWCNEEPRLTEGQYFASLFLLNVGFPLAQVMIFTIYSYVLGPFHQGSWMGIINASGSLARVLGPAVITSGYTYGGPRMIFSASAVMAGLVFFAAAVFAGRLVPFGSRVRGAYERI